MDSPKIVLFIASAYRNEIISAGIVMKFSTQIFAPRQLVATGGGCTGVQPYIFAYVIFLSHCFLSYDAKVQIDILLKIKCSQNFDGYFSHFDIIGRKCTGMFGRGVRKRTGVKWDCIVNQRFMFLAR